MKKWVVWCEDDFSNYVYRVGFASELDVLRWIVNNPMPGGVKITAKYMEESEIQRHL